jgi:hypothetical protein
MTVLVLRNVQTDSGTPPSLLFEWVPGQSAPGGGVKNHSPPSGAEFNERGNTSPAIV